ncbi:MAG TPA: HlyD family efflux transporter periplasmic adaptor subunit [Anaerolineaceae bacterium]
MNGFGLIHRMARLLPLLIITIMLGGCASLPTAATALPTLVLDKGGSLAATSPAATAAGTPAQTTGAGATSSNGATSSVGATASGKIVPVQQANIVSAQGGKIQALNVAEGDTVKTGQVLVQLAGTEKLAAAVEAANLELLTAQQAVTDLKNNADLVRSQALLRLANANDALDQAQKHRGYKEFRPGNDNQIAVARADLIVAEDTLKKTKDVYGGYLDNPADNLNKAAALSALAAAQTARDKAQANLNYLLALPDKLQVAIVDADLAVAQSEVAASQAAYDKLKNGPDPDALALAEARVKNAQAQLAASQAALSDLELVAPIDGVVNSLDLHAGEWITPGQTILTLVDASHLRVETTDLSERDIPKIQTGQAATVLVKPLNQQVPAHVRAIAPIADTLGGDVIYKTTLDLDSLPAGIRAGMSVEVQFGQ